MRDQAYYLRRMTDKLSGVEPSSAEVPDLSVLSIFSMSENIFASTIARIVGYNMGSGISGLRVVNFGSTPPSGCSNQMVEFPVLMGSKEPFCYSQRGNSGVSKISDKSIVLYYSDLLDSLQVQGEKDNELEKKAGGNRERMLKYLSSIFQKGHSQAIFSFSRTIPVAHCIKPIISSQRRLFVIDRTPPGIQSAFLLFKKLKKQGLSHLSHFFFFEQRDPGQSHPAEIIYASDPLAEKFVRMCVQSLNLPLEYSGTISLTADGTSGSPVLWSLPHQVLQSLCPPVTTGILAGLFQRWRSS